MNLPFLRLHSFYPTLLLFSKPKNRHQTLHVSGSSSLFSYIYKLAPHISMSLAPASAPPHSRFEMPFSSDHVFASPPLLSEASIIVQRVLRLKYYTTVPMNLSLS
jgi:hypothetical protein